MESRVDEKQNGGEDLESKRTERYRKEERRNRKRAKRSTSKQDLTQKQGQRREGRGWTTEWKERGERDKRGRVGGKSNINTTGSSLFVF